MPSRGIGGGNPGVRALPVFCYWILASAKMTLRVGEEILFFEFLIKRADGKARGSK